MDENSFIVGLQSLIIRYLELNPNLSYEVLDDIVKTTLEEVDDEYFTELEADNDD